MSPAKNSLCLKPVILSLTWYMMDIASASDRENTVAEIKGLSNKGSIFCLRLKKISNNNASLSANLRIIYLELGDLQT